MQMKSVWAHITEQKCQYFRSMLLLSDVPFQLVNIAVTKRKWKDFVSVNGAQVGGEIFLKDDSSL